MNYQPTTTPSVPAGLIVGLVVFYVALLVFLVWCYVRIVRRTGYSGWWVLMALVPIGNLVMLGFFAFKEWPIQQELDYLRRHASMTALPGYGAPRQQYGYGQTPPGSGPPPGYGQTPPGYGQPQHPDDRN